MTDRARRRAPDLRVAAAGILVFVLLAVFSPPGAGAACFCEDGDGVFTTHTGITIDGLFLDWTVVALDPDNNTCDGGWLPLPGQDLPIDPQPDRDAPVQSTGRDLLSFAYTWDDTHVQTYTGRVQSSSNVQRFIYYADLDNDGLMETGERVIVASWKGSNRNVDLFLGEYAAASPTGDSMVDPGTGKADGYTLPGAVTALPPTGSPDYSGTWGSADGLFMEWEIPWADAPGTPGLGLPAGSAFTFHVSSTNSQPQAGSFPGQVDDNMAGCGGGPGSTQYAGLLLEPDTTLTGASGATLCASHTVVNLGNWGDVFDLTTTMSGDFTPVVSLYRDVDADGTLSAGDTLLTDSIGSGEPDTGILTPTAATGILICYATGPADSGTAVIVTTGTSDWDDRISETVTDSVVVTQISAELRASKVVSTLYDPVNGTSPAAKSIPGAVVEYAITVENVGSGTADADRTTITDAVPAGSRLYVADIAGPGSGPVRFLDGSPSSGLSYTFSGLSEAGDDLEFSDDGGATFAYGPTPDASGFDESVTHFRVRPSGAMNAGGGGNPNFQVRFRVGIR